MKPRNSFEPKTWLFLLLISVFRMVYAAGLNALPDEADYFVWSQHLDWAYYDQSPMLMYCLAFFHLFMSHKVLVLRLVTVLLAALSSIYLFRLAQELVNRSVAFYGVVLANLTLLFMAGSMIATPDAPMNFFLIGASYYFYLAVKQGQTRLWLLAGIFTGCALLSKYVAVLVYVSFLLYLLLPEHRKWLTKAIPYVSLGLSLLIFSPVVFWNYAHHWVSFAFQWHHGFGGGKFPNWKRFAEFLGGQAGLIGPIVFTLFLAALIAVALSWQRRSAAEKFLWCLASVPFLFFLGSSLQKKVEANWPCFAYIPGIFLIMVYYEQTWQQKRWGRILWRLNWGYTVLVLGLLLVHIYLPFLPLSYDRSDEFFGWEQLGAEVVQLTKEYPDFQIAGNRYQIVSELAFYTNLPVICFNINSRPNQYDLWQDRASFQGKNYLFFNDRPATEAIVKTFERFEHLKTIPLKRGGKLIKEIFVYQAYNYRREVQ
jgi:4-amino-4-deoxy-L-arabinose transferase-like glycosyltransferase